MHPYRFAHLLSVTVFLIVSQLFVQKTASQTQLQGVLTAPSGDVPYGVDGFTAVFESTHQNSWAPVEFFANGFFQTSLLQTSVDGTAFVESSLKAAAYISGKSVVLRLSLPDGSCYRNIQAMLYDASARVWGAFLPDAQLPSLNASNERVAVFKAQMGSAPPGIYLVVVRGDHFVPLTLKLVYPAYGGMATQGSSQVRLKSASLTGSLTVSDPAGNFRDSVYTNVVLLENQTAVFNPVIRHAKKADVEFEVVRDGETIYTPIVIARGEDRDTIRTTNASLDLDRFGYEVMFEVPDLGETLPFEGMSQSDNLRPGMNEKKSFTVVPITQVPTGSVSGVIRTPTQEVPFGVMQYVGELEAVDDPTYTHQVSFTNQGEFSLENVTTTLDEMVGREFVLRVSDPNQNLKDTTYTDINVYNNQNTELQKQMKHNKKAEFAFVVRDSNLQRINDVPVVFSNEIDGILQTDTTWIDDPASGIGQASLDLDKLGYSPLASMEYVDDVSTRPFKPHQETMSLQPGNNPNKTFTVELYQDQKLILQLINPIDTTQVIPNNQVRIRYVNDNLRQEIYYTNEQGIVELERRPKNDVIAIGIAGNETYFGRSGMEGTELKYQLVKNENMEERVQKIALVPKTLPTGNPENPTVEINSFEWNQAYAGVSLQAANKEMNIHFNHPYITTEKFQEYLDYFSEQMGITYQMVPTNKDPGAVPDYNYYTNNYKHGNEEVFTNSFSQGDPRTINQIAEFNGKLVLRSTIATSPGTQNTVFKEIWRMAGLDGTGYGSVSSANGGTEFNDKERAVARMKIEMDHLYVKGTDYAPAKNIVTE